MNGDITYVGPGDGEWLEFRPGSRWKILFEDPATGQRAVLVEWEPGYRMGAVDHHERDEVVFVLSGTFVQDGRPSGPGTYIHHWAGSQHQASTPDGCTFLEVLTGHPERSGEVSEEELAWFRSLITCSPERQQPPQGTSVVPPHRSAAVSGGHRNAAVSASDGD